MLSWRYQHCGFAPLVASGARMTGLETAAIIGAVAGVGSLGMSIIGGFQQAEAQRQAGEAAYRAALVRQQQMEAQARELENQAVQRENQAKIHEQRANETQAVAQRRSIEQKRKSRILASRAQAVMAASGAGVDPTVLSSLLSEGEYAGNISLYEGDVAAGDSRYAATVSRYQADLDRYSAKTKRASGQYGVNEGAYTRGSYYNRADATTTGTIGKAIFSGLSLASKYAPDFGGSAPGTGATIGGIDEGGYAMTEWNRYDALGRRLDGTI